jgi:hypothetical protein
MRGGHGSPGLHQLLGPALQDAQAPINGWLASTPDQTSNSGTTFWIECSADVAGPVTLYSATAPRQLVSGSQSIPLALSAEFPGGPELPYSSPGTALALGRGGSAETVVLYGKVRSLHFSHLPSGNYVATLSLTVEY